MNGGTYNKNASGTTDMNLPFTNQGVVNLNSGTLQINDASQLKLPTLTLGAGSTLVAPLMAKWSQDFEAKNNIQVTYGSVGSGAGIAQITARTVDFGASDAPLTYHLDGEPVVGGTTLRARVHGAALLVAVAGSQASPS